MSWVGIVFLSAFALAAALAIHGLLHLRTYWKDHPMAKLSRDEDPTPSEGVVIGGDQRGAMAALPPEHSVNDVHLMRANDQTIAQLAAQYDDMSQGAWVLGTVSKDPACWPSHQVPKTKLRAYALVLTLLMNPPAAKGAQEAVSGHGRLYYINVGNQRIVAKSSDACNELLKKVNDAYYAAIDPWRKELIGHIRSLAEKDEVVPFTETLYSVECGQTKVVVLDDAQQRGMQAILSTAFKPFFDDERRRILDELIEATDA